MLKRIINLGLLLIMLRIIDPTGLAPTEPPLLHPAEPENRSRPYSPESQAELMADYYADNQDDWEARNFLDPTR